MSTYILPLWFKEQGNSVQCRRPGFNPWVAKISWTREWQPTPVFLPGEFHGQRSLAGHSPWGLQRVGQDWVTNTFIYFILSWFTTLYSSQVYNKVNQLYTYICPLFFRFFSPIGHYKVLRRFPCAIQLLVIYFIYSNVHMSPPISQLIPPPFKLYK